MSTKVYGGLRAVDTDPFVAAAKIRAVLNPMFVNWLLAQVPDRKGLRDAHRQMLALKAQAIHTSDPLDIGFDVLLLPALGEGTPLVLLYSEESPAYRRALIRAKVCVDFSYWDNSDKPRGVTKAAWEDRKRQWGALGDRSPSECGLLITEPGYVPTMLSLVRTS